EADGFDRGARQAGGPGWRVEGRDADEAVVDDGRGGVVRGGEEHADPGRALPAVGSDGGRAGTEERWTPDGGGQPGAEEVRVDVDRQQVVGDHDGDRSAGHTDGLGDLHGRVR